MAMSGMLAVIPDDLKLIRPDERCVLRRDDALHEWRSGLAIVRGIAAHSTNRLIQRMPVESVVRIRDGAVSQYRTRRSLG
jgi:hypothetical protein